MNRIPSIALYAPNPSSAEADCVLAEHYGFTDVELDFIINYDIKYPPRRRRGSVVEEE